MFGLFYPITPKALPEGSPLLSFPTTGGFLANARKDRVMRGRRPERSEGCLAVVWQHKVHR